MNLRKILILISVAVLMISTSAQADLVAYYDFETGANDVSGNDNHGEVFGAKLGPGGSQLKNDSEVDHYYHFDGLDDYIRLPINTNPSNYPELTIGGWITPDPPAYTGKRINRIASNGVNSYNRAYGLDYRGSNDEETWYSANNEVGVTSNDEVYPDIVKTFVSIVYGANDGYGNGYVRIHVNGTECTFSGIHMYDSGYNYTIVGGSPELSESGDWIISQLFTGKIYDLFIFDEALDIFQINDIRLNGVSLPEPPPVPIPTTACLLSLGVLWLVSLRRKQFN